MEIEYTVSPGRTVKTVTALIILLFLSFLVGIPFIIYIQKGMVPEIYFVLALMLFLYIPILAGAWAYSPQKYIVSDEGILIKRPIKSLFIPLERIDAVEERDIKTLKLIRLFGNGGLFSITGRFWSKEYGNMYFYAKNSNYVMIHADRLYVLSPDERFQFVNHLKKLIERRKKVV